MFFGCEGSLTQPGRTGFYESGSLEQQPRAVDKLDSTLPSGTIYKEAGDTTTFSDQIQRKGILTMLRIRLFIRNSTYKMNTQCAQLELLAVAGSYCAMIVSIHVIFVWYYPT